VGCRRSWDWGESERVEREREEGGRESVRRALAGGPEVCHRGMFVKRKKRSQRTRIDRLIL
jgi:hypothetical protein